MKLWFIIAQNCALFLLFSCTSIPSPVCSALEQAGINRTELEKVIEHYKANGEEQKLKAAYFLIANMPGKYAEYYNYNEKAYQLFIEGKAKYSQKEYSDYRVEYLDTLSEQIDMLKDLAGRAPLIIQDIESITGDYLIESIDYAFKAWQEPWAKHFTFDEFCEYILPYRILHEPISNWRKLLYEKYHWVRDSIKNVSDPTELTMYINDFVAKDYWTVDELDMPYTAVPLMEKAKGGACSQRYVLMISILRAMGVPAMMDYAPQHNSTFKSHSWMVYMDSTHRYHPCDGGRMRGKAFNKDAFPEDMMIPLADGFGSNAYRYTFAINENSLAEEVADKNTLPSFFRNSCIRNVTEQYKFNQHPIVYSVEPIMGIGEGELAYLSVFGYGRDIRETAYTRVRNHELRFESAGSGIVYLISTYKDGRLMPFSPPILLCDTLGTMEVLEPDTVHRQNMILTRKCKVSLQMLGFAEDMIGGRFEGSHTPSFESPETLFEIKEAPSFLTEAEVKVDTPYQYVRYLSPRNEIHIAEIQFWGVDRQGKKTMLKGSPIQPGIDPNAAIEKPEYAFDNNIRTNYNAASGAWIGQKFPSPQRIHQIKYLPRNNFNVIEAGNNYELLYYGNRGWTSLGIQTATNQYLEYENVPSHALFLLKNLTQGKEERIFTYENGKQVWW